MTIWHKKMKLFIRVRPNAKVNRVDGLGGGRLAVFVKAPPADGRANHAAIEVVAKHLGIPISRIKIISGYSAKNKILQII